MIRSLKRMLSLALGLVAIALLGTYSHANDEEKTSSVGIEDLIKSKLNAARPDLSVTDVKPSVVSGIYEVSIPGGHSLYVSADVNYFFLGDLYQIQPNKLVNLTESAKNVERANMLASVKDEDLIIFPAKGKPKATISVFTDVDCGYCRKLHREVPKMNELGISVKYLAYPRAGLESKSYEKIASAWCAEDRNEALTAVKSGQSIETNVCQGNPVADHYHLGVKVGVRGTPAIVLESGEMLPGYIPADELAKQLGIQ